MQQLILPRWARASQRCKWGHPSTEPLTSVGKSKVIQQPGLKYALAHLFIYFSNYYNGGNENTTHRLVYKSKETAWFYSRVKPQLLRRKWRANLSSYCNTLVCTKTVDHLLILAHSKGSTACFRVCGKFKIPLEPKQWHTILQLCCSASMSVVLTGGITVCREKLK